MKYAWFTANKSTGPISLTCETLDVSVSGYFEHKRRGRTQRPTQRGNGRPSNKALLAHSLNVARLYGKRFATQRQAMDEVIDC